MDARRVVECLVCALLVVSGAAAAEARSLSDQINTLFGTGGITLDVQPSDPRVPPHTAHFSNSSLATLGLLVGQLAPTAADFPAISTVPGFTYRYDPAVDEFERATTSLGSAFVERAHTLGRGKFDLGVAYLFVDFDKLEGKDIDTLSFADLAHSGCCASPPSPGAPQVERDTARVQFEKFTLRSHVASFFATYGVTDRWDVNVLVPVVFTRLKVRAQAVLDNQSGVHFFDNETRRVVDRQSIDDEKTGIGDVQLRTKLHLFDAAGANLASGLAVRFPSGDQDDFQGIGDYLLTPFLALSQEVGPLEAHASGGIDIDFDDSDRSRARYAGGLTFQPVRQLAVSIDVLGSSNVRTDRISLTVPLSIGNERTPSASTRVSQRLRTDIIDLVAGIKVVPFGSVVAFASVFVPLNDDGLRPDVIPAAGVEVSF